MRSGDVNYEIEVLGEHIPGREGKEEKDSSPRYSPLQDKITEIKESEKYWRLWIAIADYGNGNVASGAMRDMKRHYGEIPEIGGFTFTTHRYAIKDSETDEFVRDEAGKVIKRCKLVVKYDPGKIDHEKRRKWERDQIMIRGREAAAKLGIDVDNISPRPIDDNEVDRVSTLLPPGHSEKP